MTSAKALPERMFTFARWQQLLERAWAEGIVIGEHPTNPNLGRTFSRTQLDHNNKVVIYTMSVYGCSCPARGMCKHRALFLFERPALIPLAVLPPTASDESRELAGRSTGLENQHDG